MGRRASSGKGRRSGGKSKTQDLKTLEGLSVYGKELGLGKEVDKIINKDKNKLSLLQRLNSGLGAFNPAEAILTGKEKGLGAGIGKYVSGIATGLAEGISGRDIDKTERRTFKDVAGELGIENKLLKGGIGFLGDVFLDPTTYFGGTIAKGLLAPVKGGINLARKIEPVGEVIGGVERGFGRAFKYGYGTSKGLPEQALELQSKLGKAKEEIVASNLDRLGTRTLSKSQQQELVQKLLAGKRAEFEAGRGATGKALGRRAAQSSDPLVQKTIEEQSLRSQKFARQAGIQDPYEIYFPGLKNDSIKNFFEGTKNLRVGSQGYLKEFKNILKDEQLIKNPAEAFAKREFDIAKDNIVRGELNSAIKNFGKPLNAFKSAEEASKAGFKLVREKGMFGKELGYLNDVDKKFLDDLISPEFTTIDAIAKATGFDALTSLFKRSVTGLFAPFHIRNYVSGMIQNFEVLGVGALNPKTISAGNRMAYRLAKDDKTLFTGKFGKEMKAFADRFGTSSSYIADIADATRQSTPGIAKGLIGKTLGPEAPHFRLARGVGNFIETQQKATAYLTALSQGKTIPQALDLATRAGFDYRALTGFESKILRRIIPFYSFTKKNIELQLRTLGENPQRINQVMSLLKNIGEDVPEGERQNLPDYIKRGFGVSLGKDAKTGLNKYVANFGTPIEAFTELFKPNTFLTALSMTNPIIKAPTEISIGKDSFRQKDLKDVYNAKEYSNAPQFIKDLLQIKEVQKQRYEKRGNKLVPVSTYTEYVANPERLLIARSLFTSRGFTYFDNILDKDVHGLDKLLNIFTGVKSYPIDTEINKALEDKQTKRALEDLFIKLGNAKEFRTVYEK